MQDQVADVGAFFDPIHGLWTPNEALFFIEIPIFWAWADNLDR